MCKSYIPYLQHILDECKYIVSVITPETDVDEKHKYDLKVGQVTGKNVCGRLINEIRRKGSQGEEAIKSLIDENLGKLDIKMN